MKLRAILSKTLQIGFVTFLALGFALLLLWRTGLLVSWIRSQAVKTYLTHIAPHLPFEIEDVQISGDWSQFKKGTVPDLGLVLKWDSWRIRMHGPFQLNRYSIEKEFSIYYKPELTVEPAQLLSKDRSPVVPIVLSARIHQNLKNLHSFEIQSDLERFHWPLIHTQLEKVKFKSDWKVGQAAQLTLSTYEINWKGDSEDHLIHLQDLKLQAETSLEFKNPVQFGPEAIFDLAVQSGEVLWDSTYLDLPLKKAPIQGGISWEEEEMTANLQIGASKTKQALISGTFHPQNPSIEIRWQTPTWNIRDVVQELLEVTRSSTGKLSQLSVLKEFEVLTGKIRTTAHANIPLKGFDLESADTLLEGKIDIQDFSARWDEMALAIKSFNLLFPFSTHFKTSGTVAAEKIFFRQLEGELGKTAFSIFPSRVKDRRRYAFKTDELPIYIQSVPLQIGKVTGLAQAPEYALITSLKLKRMELDEIVHRLCIPQLRLPPTRISANFPKIEIRTDSVDFTGKITSQLFDGIVEIDDIGVFDLGTSVPEVDFNLDFEKIRLDLLGDWTGIGKIDGILQGYAHDVVFQSYLPTQYTLRVDALPHQHRDILFSPGAMKNFLKIITGDISYLPPIAQWWAFGWPRKIGGTFGTYDVQYAGFSLVSKDGLILLETNDPPAAMKQHPNQHYLLSGKSFKMPLISSRYPLIIDAIAMSNYLYQMKFQLSAIAKEKEKSENISKKEDDEYEESNSCLPPRF